MKRTCAKWHEWKNKRTRRSRRVLNSSPLVSPLIKITRVPARRGGECAADATAGHSWWSQYGFGVVQSRGTVVHPVYRHTRCTSAWTRYCCWSLSQPSRRGRQTPNCVPPTFTIYAQKSRRRRVN